MATRPSLLRNFFGPDAMTVFCTAPSRSRPSGLSTDAPALTHACELCGGCIFVKFSVHSATGMHMVQEMLLDVLVSIYAKKLHEQTTFSHDIALEEVRDLEVYTQFESSQRPMAALQCLPLIWGHRLVSARCRAVGGLPASDSPLSIQGCRRLFAEKFCGAGQRETDAVCRTLIAASRQRRLWRRLVTSGAVAAAAWRRQCAQIRRQLITLRDAGVLTVSMNVRARRGIPFERLECIGDHTFGSCNTGRLRAVFYPEIDLTTTSSSQAPVGSAAASVAYLPTLDNSSFELLRTMVESAVNMSEVAADLSLLLLLYPSANDSSPVNGKYLADLFECVLGELRVALWTAAPAAHSVFTDADETLQFCGSSSSGLGASIILLMQETLDGLLDLLVLNLLTRRFSATLHCAAAIIGELNLSSRYQPFTSRRVVVKPEAVLSQLEQRQRKEDFVSPATTLFYNAAPAFLETHAGKHLLPSICHRMLSVKPRTRTARSVVRVTLPKKLLVSSEAVSPHTCLPDWGRVQSESTYYSISDGVDECFPWTARAAADWHETDSDTIGAMAALPKPQQHGCFSSFVREQSILPWLRTLEPYGIEGLVEKRD